eukprot:RCo005658
MGQRYKGIVIDGAGHLMGRLASVVAKQLLRGEKVCVLRCEGINVSGSLARNKLKYLNFLKKTMITNPRKGPKHYRAPTKMFWKVVRGMLPYRRPHGRDALLRLKLYEGIPPIWNRTKRMCVPSALRYLRLRPDRRFCSLGELADQLGWKHKKIVEELETKRKRWNKSWYHRKRQILKLRKFAEKMVDKAIPRIKLGNPNIKIGTL